MNYQVTISGTVTVAVEDAENNNEAIAYALNEINRGSFDLIGFECSDPLVGDDWDRAKRFSDEISESDKQ